MKKKNTKIAMVTAYDYPSSCISHGVSFDQRNASELCGTAEPLVAAAGEESSACLPDILLVGDSVGQVVLGHESTSTVTLQHMLHHTAAVTAARRHPGVRKQPLVVTDLPFGSFRDAAHAVDAAIQSVQVAGAGAVKIEGASRNAERVASVTEQGVAVMGHIGLLPQTADAAQGGFRVQGKTASSAAQLVADAIALQEAGACSLVLELVPAQLADIVSHAVHIPVIGIGAGAGTDGQVLVWHDFMGLNAGHVPRFVQQYASTGSAMQDALHAYVRDVKGGAFPSAQHSTNAKQTTLQALSEQFTAAMQASAGAENRQAALERALSRTGELLVAAAEEGSHSSATPRTHRSSAAPVKQRSLHIPLSTAGAVDGGHGGASSSSSGLRVAIVGSGAVAQLLAATLGQQTGVQCVLVPSRQERFHELQQRGALSVQLQGGLPAAEAVKGVQLAAPGQALGGADVVMVACKGQYTPRVMREVVHPLLQGCASPPLLVSAQNGLAALQATQAAAEEHGCAAAVCVQSHGALLQEGGQVAHTGVGAAALGFIGSSPPSPPSFEALGGCLAELLHTCGLAGTPSVQSTKDIHTAVAKKFAVNCALNAAAVLLNAPNGSLLRVGAAGRALLAEAAREALLAARHGTGDMLACADWEALLGPDAGGDAFAAVGGWEVARHTSANTCSTLADVQRGAQTEGLNEWVAQHLPAGGNGSTNAALAAAVRCVGALRAPPSSE